MSEKEENAEVCIKWFSELGLANKNEVGEKAAYISELYKKKFPVPPGFVIVSDNISNKVEQEIKEAYDILDVDNVPNANKSALTILKNSHEPPFVSVRISADKEEESTINVKGKEALIEAVKKAYSSIQGEENGKSIIVQKMIDADKAGYAYISKREPLEETMIEAIWGNGIALKLRMVEPDKYKIAREADLLNIKDIVIGNKKKALVRDASGKNHFVELAETRSSQQVLNNYEIKVLAQYVSKAEEIFGAPQKISFIVSLSEVFILGSKDVVIETEQEEAIQEGGESEEFSGSIGEMQAEVPEILPRAEVPLNYQGVLLNGFQSNSNLIRMSEIGRGKEKLKEASEGINNLNFMLSSHLTNGKHLRVRDELVAISELSKEYSEKNIQIIIPGVKDAKNVKELMRYAKVLGVSENIKFGACVETPSAVQLVNQICESGVEMIVIDFESLARNMLSAEQDEKADLNHPALDSALSYVLRRANKYGIKNSLLVSDNINLERKHVESAVNGNTNGFFAKEGKAEEIKKYLEDIHTKKDDKKEDIEYTPLNLAVNVPLNESMLVPEGFSVFF